MPAQNTEPERSGVQNSGNFCQTRDEIRAFSDDTARLFKRAYPDVYNLHVIPHAPHYLPAVKKIKNHRDL